MGWLSRLFGGSGGEDPEPTVPPVGYTCIVCGHGGSLPGGDGLRQCAACGVTISVHPNLFCGRCNSPATGLSYAFFPLRTLGITPRYKQKNPTFGYVLACSSCGRCVESTGNARPHELLRSEL